MNEEELKAALTKAQDSIKALEAKNFDVIGKLQSAESAREEAAERAEREAKDVEALEKRLNSKFQKQIADLAAERDTLAAEIRTTRVDNEVAKAIASSNVRPELVPAVEALLLRQATYEDGVATINGKSISDAAKSFFSSKDGSHYVRAPESSGSGSTGATTVDTSGWAKAPETADEFGRYMKLTVDNPAAATALSEKWNRPDLKP